MFLDKRKVLTFLFVVVALLAVGCSELGIDTLATPGTRGPAASSLLPNLPGYTRIESSSIQDFISGLGEAGTALTGQFGATAAIGVVDRIASCYRDIGVLDASGYSQDALPVVAGVVAVVNRSQLTNPANFLNCVGVRDQGVMADPGPGMQPCTNAYTTELQGDTYDIIYAATDSELCNLFCASLPNCTR